MIETFTFEMAECSGRPELENRVLLGESGVSSSTPNAIPANAR